MAMLLSERGHEVAWVADPVREARERAARVSGAEAVDDPVKAAGPADLVLLTTPDAEIRPTAELIARSLADLSGKKFIHMSGALSLEALASLRAGGAEVLSIHPLQTFADLEGAAGSLPGSTFGVTCDPGLEEWAASLVAELDGTVRLIADSDKALYHAAAAMACNLVAMVEYGALRVARELGFDDEEFSRAFMPLARATIDNIARLGPVRALTGPLARGDAATVEKHLRSLHELDPALEGMYRTVCEVGIELLKERDELSADKLESILALLRKPIGPGRNDRGR